MVKITSSGVITRVEVDGTEVKHVSGLKVEFGVGKIPKVSIEVLCIDGMEIQAEDCEFINERKVIDVTHCESQFREYIPGPCL